MRALGWGGRAGMVSILLAEALSTGCASTMRSKKTVCRAGGAISLRARRSGSLLGASSMAAGSALGP